MGGRVGGKNGRVGVGLAERAGECGENGGRSNGGHSGSSKVAGDCRRFFCGLIGDGLRVSFGPARWGLSEPLD